MSRAVAGRDARAVRHPGPSGAAGAADLGWRPRAVVVGGGVAGLAAATALAERGVTVTLLEREDQLGGRVGSWTHRLADGSRVSMGRGFHAFFRQYYNLRALLGRIDPELDVLRPLPDYPLVDETGRVESMRGLPRTPPLNAGVFALRSRTFGVRDLVALDARAAAPLADVSVPGVYAELDHLDADRLLRRVNFPPAARHLAFEVFTRSFFAPPTELSAAELALMFHIYFLGSSEGLLFDVPRGAFSPALWEPLAGYLAARGVELRTGTPAAAVESGARHRWRVRTAGGGTLDADGVVLATDVGGLQRIVAGSPTLDDEAWRARVGRLALAPPFLVHRLWLDRPVRADRPAFLAAGGLPPLDNVTVLDRYEREAAQWARRHHGSVVELHAYATAQPAERVTAGLRDRLHRLYPETAAARVVGEAVLVRQDCPLWGVGAFAHRPPVATPFPGLVLAGDGIRLDLPAALMERAASTGLAAANRLLGGWGLAGEPLVSVPNRGRVALLRRLAARERRRS